jgi:hypothetical protein
LRNFVFPLASQVQLDVLFGSFGTEITGTLQSGGPPPATPTLTIKDNRNGTTATALIQGSADGSVNKVYVRRVGSTATTLAGTRSGNGNITLTLNKGEYFSCITSTLGGTSANIGSHFYISKVTQTRADIRDGGAKAALELAKQFGLQVDLVLNTSPETTVTLWAIDRTAEDITTIHGGNTGVRGAILEIPRQVGFPPDFVQIQSYFVIPSGSTELSDRYGIDNGDSVNDNIGIKSVFTFHCSRMDFDTRLGG